MRSAAIRIELVSGSIMALSSMLLRSGIGVAAFVGIHLLTSGRIDFLVMLMFLLIATRIYGPILTVLTLLPDILYLQVSNRRLRTLMDSEVMTGETSSPIRNTDLSFDTVKRLGIVMKRAKYFITCKGKYFGGSYNLQNIDRTLRLQERQASYAPTSLF